MSENLYEVGDEFEGGPAEISRWITEVTSKGYDFHLSKEGVLTIISVPEKKEKKSKAKAPVTPVDDAPAAAEVEEVVEEAIDTAVKVAVEASEELDEVVIAPEPKAPAKRGRKPAAKPENTEE